MAVGTYGMQALIDDTTDNYVQDDTPAGKSVYRARFYINKNTISMGNQKSFVLFAGTGSSFEVELYNQGRTYSLPNRDKKHRQQPRKIQQNDPNRCGNDQYPHNHRLSGL